jgi:hypothetical protein
MKGNDGPRGYLAAIASAAQPVKCRYCRARELFSQLLQRVPPWVLPCAQGCCFEANEMPACEGKATPMQGPDLESVIARAQGQDAEALGRSIDSTSDAYFACAVTCWTHGGGPKMPIAKSFPSCSAADPAFWQHATRKCRPSKSLPIRCHLGPASILTHRLIDRIPEDNVIDVRER